VLELAMDCLQLAGVAAPVLDLADARILRGVLAGVPLESQALTEIVDVLSKKDAAGLAERTAPLPAATREALGALLGLYGGEEVLAAARTRLPARPLVQDAIDQLEWLGSHLQAAHPGVRVGFDLSDMSGYAYYSGPRFAIFGVGATDPLARGGRYDEVGAAFGRNRPAAGFSLDLKALAALGAKSAAATAIQAPWGEDPALRAAVRALRDAGETVVAVLPGHEVEGADFDCDRELVQAAGRWMVQARAPRSP
jgi:ATP phosphoribosyltransferase regulatory subunit